MLHDFAVDEEEDLNFVFREFSIDVLVVEFNRGVEERLPGLLRLSDFTDFN